MVISRDEVNFSPKKIIKFDAFGAGLSSFLLGFVLVKLEYFFGIPPSILYLLASIPLGILIYDLYCLRLKIIKPSHLKVLYQVNVSYCVLSLILVFQHLETVTIWGWLYIVGEIVIVLTLCSYEWKIARNLEKRI